MPVSNLKLLLIGGFGFNELPLKGISELFGEYRFIDINQFSENYTLEMMADKLIQIQSQYMANYIVAFSMGGLLVLKAMELSAMPLADKVILLNSNPCFMTKENWQGVSHQDYESLLTRLSSSSFDSFMTYLSRFFAYPYPISKEVDYKKWWANTDHKRLLNLLSIFVATDLREKCAKFIEQITWINSSDDALVKMNQSHHNSFILDNSSHLLLDKYQLNKLFNNDLLSLEGSNG